MRLAIIDGSTLTAALRRMSAAPRGMSGAAFWSFGDELVIRWTSYEEPLPITAAVSLPEPLQVPGDVMEQLATGIDLEGPVEVVWDAPGGRLRIGPHALPAARSPAPPFTLPLDARPRDLLPHLLRDAPAAVAAGYAQEAEALTARWEETLDAVTEALAWTGLTRSDLEAALVEMLQSGGS
jgi:hypothetical protein